MAHKQIVFPGDATPFGMIDIALISVLAILIGVAVYYIVTAPKSTTIKVVQEMFTANKKKKEKKREKFLSGPKDKSSGKQATVKYVFMDGCPHCVKFNASYEETSQDIDLAQKFKFEKMDVKSAEAAELRKSCDGYPCYVVIKGDAVVAKASGYRSTSDFKSWLTSTV
jgi:hypothetical protein